jgi:Zn-dependent peptidase ImmA (M78 family)/transcriptional regulator with XRE-family HTH domain
MTNQELGSKLRQARERVGLTLKDASLRLGFSSYQTLSKIESGEREVRASELGRFAKHYFCKISDFLTPEEDIHPAPAFLWRKIPEGSKKKELEAQILKYVEHGVFLETLLGKREEPKLEPLQATPDDIQDDLSLSRYAARISRALDLGKRPALSLQQVLEQDFLIKVIYCDLENYGSAASILDDHLGAVVVINSSEASWRRNYDLAHEIFHLATWKFASPAEMVDQPYFNEIERKADSFAANLLLPAEEVKNEIQERIKDHKIASADIVDIARDFGVSFQALIYRMANLRIISWDKAKEAANNRELYWENRLAREEEIHQPPKSERLTSLAIRCLRKGLISRGKFAEIVQIKRPEIDDFIDGFGQLSQEGETIEVMAS